MTTKSDGGKGDTYRPVQDRDQFDKNWDAIFGKKKEEPKQQDKKDGKEKETERKGCNEKEMPALSCT